jgi:amino acid transporter
VWVLNALGPFWAFQTGYWAWVSGVIDNAIYPALAVATFTDVYGSIDSPVAEYFIKAAIALALALPNLLGIRIVGRGMALMSIFVMVPFAVLFVWGVIRAEDWGAVGEIRRADIVYDGNGDFVSMSGGIDVRTTARIAHRCKAKLILHRRSTGRC